MHRQTGVHLKGAINKSENAHERTTPIFSYLRLSPETCHLAGSDASIINNERRITIHLPSVLSYTSRGANASGVWGFAAAAACLGTGSPLWR